MRWIGYIGLAVAAVLVTGALTVSAQGGYRVDVVLPSATNINEGSPVLVDGLEAGSVVRIRAQDGKARLTLELHEEYSPLHAGAKVIVRWKALVGERLVEVHDGPRGNAEVPSGGLLPGKSPAPMEIDQVLAALDKPTRKRLQSLVGKLDDTLNGQEENLRETLKSAGPAISALGKVLKGLGTDGAAIKQLVAQLDQLVGTVASGDEKVRTIVDRLSALAEQAAAERNKLSKALDKAPSTVEQATQTLGRIPGVVDEVSPLLDELRPAVARLPGVAAQLEPLLKDLRPVIDKLRPTLVAADKLLGHTPGLLDSAHQVLPGLNTTLAGLRAPLHFLRPYTPEAVGALANWSSALGNYGGSGHYARFNVTVGAHSVGSNPGILPPGYHKKRTPAPGSLAGQAWTDAYGSGVR